LRALPSAYVGELTMLEVSQRKTFGAGEDNVEGRPAKTEAAGLAGQATDHFGPAFDFIQ
jgi:hypothetical protein